MGRSFEFSKCVIKQIAYQFDDLITLDGSDLAYYKFYFIKYLYDLKLDNRDQSRKNWKPDCTHR